MMKSFLLLLVLSVPVCAQAQVRVQLAGSGTPAGYCNKARYTDTDTGDTYLCDDNTNTWGSATPSTRVLANTAIVGGTKTKLTYDAKGLVTAGVDATTADIADSSDKRYMTDAHRTVISNTSGTNTGDQNLAGYQLLDSDLTAIAGLNATTDNFIVSVASTWASRTPTQVKSTLALNNLDNTSDANKPVSTAQQAALDLKANLASPTLTGTPAAPTAAAATNTTQLATTAHVFAERTNSATLTNKTLTAPVVNSPTGIVKGDVGLGSVDNTADTAKPVSTAQQTALDLKANLASPTLSGTPAAPTAAVDTNTTQVATTAYVIVQAYAKLASPVFSGTPTLPSGTIRAGSELVTAIAAPSTPAAGKGSVYVDSTSKNLAVKDDAGVVKHGIQDVTCTNQVMTSVSAAGASACTTLTSAYVNTSIAQTGTDINTSHQVTVTHLAAPLAMAQGGTANLTGVQTYVFFATSTAPVCTAGGGTTTFLGPSGAGSATETSVVRYVVPLAGTVKNLRVWLGGNVPASETAAVKVVLGGSAQATPTCSVSAGAAVCNDTSNSFAVVAGDTLNAQVNCSGGTTALNARASISFTIQQ